MREIIHTRCNNARHKALETTDSARASSYRNTGSKKEIKRDNYKQHAYSLFEKKRFATVAPFNEYRYCVTRACRPSSHARRSNDDDARSTAWKFYATAPAGDSPITVPADNIHTRVLRGTRFRKKIIINVVCTYITLDETDLLFNGFQPSQFVVGRSFFVVFRVPLVYMTR